MPHTPNRSQIAATLGLTALLLAGSGPQAHAQGNQTPPPVAPPATPPVTTPPATTPPVTPPPADTPTTGTPPAAATPPTGTSESIIDPGAKAIVDQMGAAQKALKSYSVIIDTTLVTSTNPPVKFTAKVAYEKPNKAFTSIDIVGVGTQTFETDGVQRFATNTKTPSTFARSAATKGIDNIGAILQPSRASASGILPLLIGDNNSTKTLLSGAKALSISPDAVVDGVPVDVVRAITPGPNGAVLTIEISAGKADHLLRRLDLALASTPEQNVHITETYNSVMVNPVLPAATFAFVPAPGMKVATAAPAPAAPAAPEDHEYDARLRVGAKPLPFAGTDLGGKAVNLAAYKGKVVLLDFWATWCPPCREEIPNVVAAYNRFHPKGLEIVGVSLDKAEDKAKLISYTKEHAMPWRQVYDGKFWENATAKSYGVQAIPFSVLIGKDGRIIAVNPRGEDLAPAVKAALAK